MKLKLLSILLILGLMVNVSCTSSNDESADTEAAEATEDAQLEGEEAATVDESEEGSEVAEDESTDEVAEEGDDFASDEEVIADTGEEEVVEDGTAEESAPSTDVAATEELPAESLEETGDSSQIVAEDGTGTEGTELADGSVTENPPAAEEGVFDSATSEAPVADAAPSYEEAPKMIPVKKIADAPFNKNGILLNTVYLARQGDDMAAISQKIFGSDQTATLIQANPNLSNGVKVGDKVYYNSPKRPQDAERMLTYYEDSGVPAQSYVAKSGDNIRTISKNLLGNSSSWKEVWATNMAVESKDELAEGTELRYWPEGSAGAPAVAEATPAPAPEAPQMPEPTPEAPVAANDQPAAPADDFALPDDMNNNGAAAAGTVAVEPPPPPPPPPAAAPQKSVASNDEKDLTFMLSAGGLLLVGVGVLLGIIRKGRARKMSMNTHTQI